MDELIQLAKKAANSWRGTDAYHQAAALIDALCSRLEQLGRVQAQWKLTDAYEGGFEYECTNCHLHIDVPVKDRGLPDACPYCKAATPHPAHWHDIYMITPWVATGVCSSCNTKSYINPDYPFALYCPNCGKPMYDGGTKNG